MLFNAIAGRADRKWVVLQGWWARHAPLVRAKSIRPVELLVSGHPEINENERKKKTQIQQKSKGEKELGSPFCKWLQRSDVVDYVAIGQTK